MPCANQRRLDMEIVAGLNLVSIKPKVWDTSDPTSYLPTAHAVMVSYAKFHRSSDLHDRAIKDGLHNSLGIPKHVKIYLDPIVKSMD